jgi:hypothetical protein
MKRLVVSGILMAATLVPVLRAQDEPEGGGPGVARLSLLNGDVSVRRGDSGDWVAAAINAPVLAQDRVFSGPTSRAEVQFDYYHRARLAADTELRLTELDNNKYLMQLARGTMTFSALKGGDAQVEVSTPAAAVRPVDHGEYRITVRPDGLTEITVREGEAEIYTASGSQTLKLGRTLVVRSTENGESEFQSIQAVAFDSWDEFNKARDKDLQSRAKVHKYVSRDISGAEDLEGQGDWVYADSYGYVWRPYVAAGWAPYRMGRWAWMDYYGWNWVSYDPWGWAPYHYGRWFFWGGNWCWYPGGVGLRAHWSPGVVSWFGWGGGGFSAGVGFGWGRVGWCPLAPFEPYYPWYGRRNYGGYRNGGFNNSGNVVNNYNVTNNYRNARIHGAVTVNDVHDFSRGTAGRAWQSADGSLDRTSLVRGGPVPVTPQRESLRLSERDASAHAIPRSSDTSSSRFYSRTQAARADRVPFEQQRQALEQYAGRSTTEARSGAPVADHSAETNTGRGWRSTSDSRSAETTPGTAGAGTTRSTDWQRFGEPRSTTSTTGRNGDAATGRAAQPDTGSWRTFGDPGTARGESRSTPAETRSSWSTGSATRGATDSGRAAESTGRGSTGSTGRTTGSADRGSGSTGRGASSTGPSTGSGRQADTPRTESPSRQSAPAGSGRSGDGSTGRGSSRQDMSFNSGSRSASPSAFSGGGSFGGASSAPRSSGGGSAGGSPSMSSGSRGGGGGGSASSSRGGGGGGRGH